MNVINKCDTCALFYPECPAKNLVFAMDKFGIENVTEVQRDAIVECDSYIEYEGI